MEGTAAEMLEFVPDPERHVYHVYINGQRCNFGIINEQVSDYLNATFQNKIQFFPNRILTKSPDHELYTFCGFGRPLDEGSNLGLLVIRFWIAPDHLVMRFTR